MILNTLHTDLHTFMTLSRWILHKMRNIWDTLTEKIKTHIFILDNSFPKIMPFMRKMWKQNVTTGEATYDHITRRMRFACWITKATYTLRICNIYCFPTRRSVKRTPFNVVLYVHCLLCNNNNSSIQFSFINVPA